MLVSSERYSCLLMQQTNFDVGSWMVWQMLMNLLFAFKYIYMAGLPTPKVCVKKIKDRSSRLCLNNSSNWLITA